MKLFGLNKNKSDNVDKLINGIISIYINIYI